MAGLLVDNRGLRAPEWLRPRWDQQRRNTADRVARAIARLRSEQRAVTFAAIREMVKALDGVSISTNTIQRNDLAYAIYQEHASTRAPARRRARSLARLLDQASAAERGSLRTKIARLRRASKDELIASLIQLAREVKDQQRREHALRDELLRVTVGAAMGGMRP